MNAVGELFSGLASFVGDMFKHFPKFTIVACILIIYSLWRATGGVERGEQRRAAGEEGLFLRVGGVPEAFEEEELFGVIPAEEVNERLGEEEN